MDELQFITAIFVCHNLLYCIGKYIQNKLLFTDCVTTFKILLLLAAAVCCQVTKCVFIQILCGGRRNFKTLKKIFYNLVGQHSQNYETFEKKHFEFLILKKLKKLKILTKTNYFKSMNNREMQFMLIRSDCS